MEERLSLGGRIAFGSAHDEWELIDTSAPLAMVVPLDGGFPVVAEADLIVLPSAEDPRLTLYRLSDQTWVLERADESSIPIVNLQTFTLHDRTWRFSCPDNSWGTFIKDDPSQYRLGDVHLTFSVSRDEEHVQLHATTGNVTHDLGIRVHHYLLLTLARHRQANLDPDDMSSGWLEQDVLERDPTMTPQRLNLEVFRLRKQFSALPIDDAANIVQRRVPTRQLRIGTNRISIVRL